MKRIFIFLIVIFSVITLSAQSTIVFHEDFELPSLGDSLQNSSSPIGGIPWSISTTLSKSGVRSDSNRVQSGKTIFLTTNSFSTIGSSFVVLEFAQICKLFYGDGGQIEISVDGGSTWITLGTNEYIGSGLFTADKFHDASYPDWNPGDTITKPTNSWWKNEKFNITSIAANMANVKIRFKFFGSGSSYGNGRYGWLIDDIKVTGYPSEQIPPVIKMLSYPTDTVYYGGPHIVSAYVKDASGVDTVFVSYKIGNGSFTQLGLTKSLTTDSLYTANIPYLGYGRKITYFISAKDASSSHNLALSPSSGYYSFFTKYLTGGNVIIGTGTFTQNYPFKSNSDNTKSAAIYLASNINRFGMINQLQWYVNTSQPSVNIPIKIYIKQTSSSSFIGEDWGVLLNNAILVYEGVQNFSTTGWNTIALTTPFNYNADNLMVLCEANYGGSGATSTPSFRYSSGPTNSHAFYSSNSVAVSVNAQRPNITLGFIPVPLLTQDAGISQITNPSGSVNAGIPVSLNVNIKNYATVALTKANINYSIDGNIQNPSVWTGNLLNNNTINYTVGSLNFTTGIHSIKVWTDLPNDSLDQNYFNDTAFYTFYACAGSLSGTYTVGGTSANFASFSDVYTGLTQCGISGPVVFNINPGTYSEQITLPEINGTSSINTITFKPATNDSNSVIMNHESTATSNWIVKLIGADYIIFKNIKFKPIDYLNSTSIVLSNGATNNKFIGNVFIGYPDNNPSQSQISIEGTAPANSNNLIQGNYFQYGSYAISIKGISALRLKNNVISNNIIKDMVSYGIYTQYIDSTLIDSNTIISNIYSNNKSGIYLQYGDVSNKITKNTINLSNGINMYGILAESCVSSDLTKGLISNNFVSLTNGTAFANGIRLNTVIKFKIYNNSVSCFGNSSTSTRALSATSSCSGIDLKNNILSSNWFSMHIEGSNSISLSNYNNLFSTGTNFISWNSVDYANLASFTAAVLKDSNSVSTNPFFNSLTDLHTFNSLLKAKGTALNEVTTDIDGTQRLNPPCIGADEFVTPAFDASITGILSPFSGCGLSANETVKVIIKNTGLNTITSGSYNVSYNINGNNPINPETVNRSIAPGDTIHYSFITKANLSVANTHIDSTFNLKTWSSMTADYAKGNDTVLITFISSYLPSSPVPGANVNIPYATTALLTATSSDTLQWFNTPTGGNIIGTGSQFTTPVLLNTTTFYVQSKAVSPRINYALTSTVFNGSGGGTGYMADLYKDGIIPAYGTTGTGVAGYTTTNSWFEFQWNNMVSFKKVVFYKDVRPMSNCTFQYWDGSSYVDFYNYNNSNINDSVSFPLVTTTKLRFNNVTGALTNPSFREVEVYASDDNAFSGCVSSRVPITATTIVSSKEAGISGIITPSGCSLYQVPISVKIFNHGSLALNSSNTTVTYKIDNGNFITPEALNIIINPFDTVQYTFNTLANFAAPIADRYIKVTAIVNTQNDAMHSNDTLVKEQILSQFTPSFPTSSNVNINNGTYVTLNANATSGTIIWYDMLSGGNAIGMGTTYTTPVLYASDTFFIEAKAFNTNIAVLGTGTLTNAATGFPAPYGNRFNGAKHQILIKKSELNTWGIQAGPIYSLAFDVAVLGGSQLNNLQIKMGHTALNALSIGNWVPNTTQVYSSAYYSNVLGWNTHTFTTPFVWNGFDNVVVEICYDNVTAAVSNNTQTRYTPTAFNSVALTYYAQAGVCGSNASTELYVNRPNMKINGTVPGCSSVPRIPVLVNVTLPPQNDAGIISLANPYVSTPAGVSTSVKVKIKNYGLVPLTNVKVGWKLNNTLKTTYNFTGNIAPGSDSIVTIANESFNSGVYCIKAWTFLPNNLSDSIPANDTLFNTCFNACMNGTYTIGNSLNNNFQTFNSAVNALKISGVCGNVTFLIDSGTYNEQVRIPEIMGASANSTITFRSASNDSSKVVLQYAGNSTNSYTLKLDSADFIRIEKITIKSIGTSYGYAVEIDNGACNNTIANNSIEMPNNSNPYYYSIYDHNGTDFYNKYQNNRILNGYYGFYTSSGTSTIVNKGTVISGNKILNFGNYGIYATYTDSILIIGNELISNGLIATATYALYSSSNSNGGQILKNKITLTSPSHQYGLYIYNNNGTASTHILVANNMVSLSGGASNSSIYGLYPMTCNYLDLYFNTVRIASPSSTNRAFNLWQSSNISVKNNIFVNVSGGYAYYIQTPSAIVQSEYNNIYSSGNFIGYWNGDQTTLLDLQTASTKNANSVSLNPNFVSSSDLHLVTTALSALGTPVSSVTIDIDGKNRDLVHPCIGAHEIPLLQHDAGVNFINRPDTFEIEGVTFPVKVAIKNYGTSPITSMTVSYVLNNGMPVNYTYNGFIAYQGVDTVIFPTNLTAVAGYNTLCAYTTLAGDSNTFNNQICKTFYSSPINDAKLIKIFPIQEGCGLTSDTVKILIANNGIMPINGGLSASYQKLGSSAVVTESINATIPVGGSYIHKFTMPVNLAVTTLDSLYKIKAWVSLSNDNIYANDVDTLKVSSLHTPANPIITNSLSIPYATSVSLSATSTDNTPLKWFDIAAGGNTIFSGNSYTTPMLYITDTFYVEANSTSSFNATIGNGPNTSGEPFSTLNGFTTSVSIYNASEIGGYGFINQLSWDAFKADTVNYIPINVYVKQTTQSTMNPDTLTNLLNGATLVYSGSKMFNITGWNSVNFINPYYYNSGNLMVICQAEYGGQGIYPSAIFRQTSIPGSKFHQVFKADFAPSTGLGLIYASRPNIKISGYIAGCLSQRMPIVVNVGSQPALDAGVTSILTPFTATNLSTHDTVKVMVKNYGFSPIYNFPVKYKFGNSAVTTQIMTDTIASGSSKLLTFTQTANLYSYNQAVTFNISSWTELSGDPTHQNDTAKKAVTNNPFVFCVSSATNTGNEDIGNVNFAGINNGNPLPVLSNATATQKYNDYTSLSPAQLKRGRIHPISISVIFPGGGSVGLVNVYIDYNQNGIWDLPSEFAFSQYYNGAGNSTVSGYITVPDTAKLGLCRMRIVADQGMVAPSCGTYFYGETEDYSVNINLPFLNDGSLSKINGLKTYIPYSVSNIVNTKFYIRNDGVNTLTNANINYSLNNAPPVTYAWTGSLQPLTSDSLTQNLTLQNGLNTLIAYVNGIAGDSNQYNDTLHLKIFKEYITAPPYTDDFEANKYWYAADTLNGNSINNIWKQGVIIPISSNTAHSPVNVWATQLSGNYPINNSSVLYTPVFNISLMQADTLSFWHKHDFATGTSARIEYRDVSGSWNTLGNQNDINAINWYNSSNGWTGVDTNWTMSAYSVSNLSNLGNTVQFRFVFTSDANVNTKRGWIIDDFKLSLISITNDAGVTSINSPAANSTVGDIVTVTVIVKNFGTATLSNIPVKYKIGNGNVISGSITNPLIPGASVTYTFPQTFQVGFVQNYDICAYTSVINDIYTQNDKSCKNVVVNLATNDVGIAEILQPGMSVNTGNSAVKVKIKNYGTATQTSIPVSYKRGSTTAVDEMWTGSLLAGDSVEYTFTTLLNVPLGSSFNFKAYSAFPIDAFKDNDTVYKLVTIVNGIDDFNENSFWLGQNIPNPTTGLTRIDYNIPKEGEVKFNLINLFGQSIYATSKKVNAGKNSIELNVNDIPAGVYYYSIEFNNKHLVNKMLVIK